MKIFAKSAWNEVEPKLDNFIVNWVREKGDSFELVVILNFFVVYHDVIERLQKTLQEGHSIPEPEQPPEQKFSAGRLAASHNESVDTGSLRKELLGDHPEPRRDFSDFAKHGGGVVLEPVPGHGHTANHFHDIHAPGPGQCPMC
eukprot:s9083_g1.t1